ncbi:extensin-like [Vulpes lagopus]|uniref:extensin-like n=1 Tax=Vulpes lagopus TaxID=494514 RepID=UPI001BCA135B|nr:extensin-like [Vulpes lagopus]
MTFPHTPPSLRKRGACPSAPLSAHPQPVWLPVPVWELVSFPQDSSPPHAPRPAAPSSTRRVAPEVRTGLVPGASGSHSSAAAARPPSAPRPRLPLRLSSSSAPGLRLPDACASHRPPAPLAVPSAPRSPLPLPSRPSHKHPVPPRPLPSHWALPVPSFVRAFTPPCSSVFSPPGAFPPRRLYPAPRPVSPPPISPSGFLTVSGLSVSLPPTPAPAPRGQHLCGPPPPAPRPPPTAGRPLWHQRGGRGGPRASDTRLLPPHSGPVVDVSTRLPSRPASARDQRPAGPRSSSRTGTGLHGRHLPGGCKPSLPSRRAPAPSLLWRPTSPGSFGTPRAPRRFPGVRLTREPCLRGRASPALRSALALGLPRPVASPRTPPGRAGPGPGRARACAVPVSARPCLPVCACVPWPRRPLFPLPARVFLPDPRIPLPPPLHPP